MQERACGVASANLPAGGVDEVFARVEGADTQGLLQDAAGSTLALTDSLGAIQTSYTYDPFGATDGAGAASGHGGQCTGRENDRTGLYYYRARYYSPALQRFISEDPIGLAGGINAYAYVHNNPVNLRDSFGLDPLIVPIRDNRVDWRSVSIGGGVWIIGAGATYTVDSYGNVYSGGSFSLGLSTPISASYSANTLDTLDTQPSEADLMSHIEGLGTQVDASLLRVFGLNRGGSPFNGTTSSGAGPGTPQLTVSVTSTDHLFNYHTPVNLAGRGYCFAKGQLGGFASDVQGFADDVANGIGGLYGHR